MSIVTDKSALDDFLDDYRGICTKHYLMFDGLIYIEPLDKDRLNIQLKEAFKARIEELKEG